MKDWIRFAVSVGLTIGALIFFWIGKLMVGASLASRSENIWLIISGLLMMLGFAVAVFHGFVAKQKQQRLLGAITATLLFVIVVLVELRDSLNYTHKIEHIAWKTIHDLDRRRIIFFLDGSYRLEVQKMDKHLTSVGAWRLENQQITLEGNVYEASSGYFSPVYNIIDSSGTLWLVPMYHLKDSVGVLRFERHY